MPHDWKFYSTDWNQAYGPHHYRCEKCGSGTSVGFPYGYPHPEKTVKWKNGDKMVPMTCEEIVIKKVEQQ